MPPARHDALFRLLVSDPARAGQVLRDFLPPDAAGRLDPGHPPVHVEGTAIDAEGGRTQADAIFRVRLKGKNEEALVYALLEHKAQTDPRTPLQLLRYMLRLWIGEMDSGNAADGRLPLIIPVVFYHGRGRWSAPMSVQDMIRAPAGLEPLARAFGSYTVRDLGRMDPEKLSRNPEVRAAMLALGRAFQEDVSDREADMLAAGIAETEFGSYILTYVVEQVSLPPERIEAALRRTGADPGTMERIMGTAAETWMEQGREKGLAEGKTAGIAEGKIAGIAEGKIAGIAEGEARGKAEAFLRLARVKFGDVPPACVEKIRGAAAGEIDAWLEALIAAESIEAVFESRRRH